VCAKDTVRQQAVYESGKKDGERWGEAEAHSAIVPYRTLAVLTVQEARVNQEFGSRRSERLATRQRHEHRRQCMLKSRPIVAFVATTDPKRAKALYANRPLAIR
jgi:hypothetical protein